MIEDKDNQPEQEDAKFNMALDTLKRLGSILEHIKALYLDKDLTVDGRQSIKIDLVKSGEEWLVDGAFWQKQE